ncbi:LysR family transcriptional regulator [Paraburkholderia sp. J76]|uniref:LysR family transcriptional regulator n=1 Tax=Paraburkholderia sp. J76 TaxID=2805439 RepID=UPI002ABE8C0D|nr:LysR substrate-binding domain-containing protein [Paraburkholderia sp. J76]
MELRHLKTFLAVARTLNFTRAAEQVHLAQSSVTEQIQALEADLGAALLDRSRRKLALTEAGKRLQDYAGDLLSLAEEARASVAQAAGVTAGALSVGALETLCVSRLPPLLAAFRRAHPATELQLKVAGSAALRSGVKSGALDVGFMFGEPVAAAGVESEVVGREPLVVIAPPRHRLANRAAVTAADLANEAFLVTEPGCVYRQMFDAAFPASPRGVPPAPRLAGEFGSIAAIVRLVESGLGCALVPALVAADAREPLTVLAWAGDAASVPVVMSWRARRTQPVVLREFLAAARESAIVTTDGDRLRHAALSR